MTVRVAGDDLRGAMAFLEAEWRRYFANHPFAHFFIDERLGQLYAAEERLGRVVGYFSVLAVFIACLGLFGLASFMAERRTKEIGVRKVLGASVSGLVLLLTRDVVGYVAAAFVLAAPLAYFAAARWLAGFAYHAAVPGWTLLGAGAVVLGVAVLTVGYQAVKTARLDPARTLRYE